MLFRRKPDMPHGDEAPIVKLANAILQQAIVDKASDIRFTSEDKRLVVDYFVDGNWCEAMVIPKNLRELLIRRFIVMAGIDVLREKVAQSGQIDLQFQGKAHYFLARTTPVEIGEVMHLSYQAG